MCGEAFISKLLDRKWMLLKPDTNIHQIMVSGMQIQQGQPLGNVWFSNNTSPSLGDSMMEKNNPQPSFYVVRDDLLHPLVNGNKARKLDGLLPLVEDHSVTDMTFSRLHVEVAKAIRQQWVERGLRSHLLFKGEQPEIPTGYNLISILYGSTIYVPRSLYAKREKMLAKHADLVAGGSSSVVWLRDILEASLTTQISGKPNCERLDGHRYAESLKKVVIVNEGAGDAVGLLGVIRLVQYLSQKHVFGKEQAFKIVVDAGTGTTAIGLGLGAICLGLPWKVYAVEVAENIDGYRRQEEELVSDFQRCCGFPIVDQVLNRANGRFVHWLERSRPRKFGNVLTGEMEMCQQIAQQTGVLVDPIYTLASLGISNTT
ncbi:hypothetical protein LOK49_LG10G00252 [Camellia lanceoleosa]|uniref:Uncharacterized protein n=1 Tax=Camellia lanceoleosa TaxID=1840588 RepID=A0ACC0G7G2_9ERIC|nr:hypothetical protein LOK49_LG10G00252 [Camellia lanceoleosa]